MFARDELHVFRLCRQFLSKLHTSPIDIRSLESRLTNTAPGVDAKWETNLYGLVRTGDRPGAIRFLQGTRRISRAAAAKRVAKIAADLGMA